MKFFVFALMFCISPLNAHVIQTESLELLEGNLASLTHHDLVIFDNEKTLTLADDALLQSCGIQCLIARIQQTAPYLAPQKVEELVSIILQKRRVKVMDPRSHKIIQALQNKGVKVFVITDLKSGSYGRIPKTEYWQLQELKQMGFDFRQTFPSINRVDFPEFSGRPHPPVFVQGLYCSGALPKGEALFCFFKEVGVRPRQIVLVDHSAHHHESVSKWARRLKIPFLGYHYTQALKQQKHVDEQIANFQIRYLIDHEEWIDDLEAKRRLKWNTIPT